MFLTEVPPGHARVNWLELILFLMTNVSVTGVDLSGLEKENRPACQDYHRARMEVAVIRNQTTKPPSNSLYPRYPPKSMKIC